MTTDATTATETGQSTETGETDQTTSTSTGDETTETVDSLRAEREKWKAESRKQEQRAKANAAAAKELDKVREANLTETEKAVAAARTEGRTEGLRQGSSRIVAAEIRAAAAGRSVNVDALLEGVDTARFIDDDGDVDTKAIGAWVDKVAPAGEQRPRTPDLGQGARTVSTPGDAHADFEKFLRNSLAR